MNFDWITILFVIILFTCSSSFNPSIRSVRRASNIKLDFSRCLYQKDLNKSSQTPVLYTLTNCSFTTYFTKLHSSDSNEVFYSFNHSDLVWPPSPRRWSSWTTWCWAGACQTRCSVTWRQTPPWQSVSRSIAIRQYRVALKVSIYIKVICGMNKTVQSGVINRQI